MFIDNITSLSTPSNDDFFSTTGTELSQKLLNNLNKGNSGILYLLNSVVLTLLFFTKLSFVLISRYQNYNDAYLDSYVKRVPFNFLNLV